ncbi:MAG: hypothetical protein MUF83_19535 [Acidimicrobiales bacterium]|jgi:hypothetical protein|nr:hypothetical protein [Acidimicrobiales bacterium]
MYLRVDTTAKTMALVEPDDTDEFHLEVPGSTDLELIDETVASQGAGRLVGGDAWISIVWLRAHAEGNVGDDWPMRFQKMLDYAGSKGWLNDDRTYVRGHIKNA